MSRDLQAEFPEMKWFFLRNLKYMLQWFRFWSAGPSIGQQLVAQIPGGHNLAIRARVSLRSQIVTVKERQGATPEISAFRIYRTRSRHAFCGTAK